MSDQRAAIKEAMNIYKRRASLDQFGKEDAVATLAKHGLWSKRQISSIVDVAPYFVGRRVEKTDNTGGRLNPESFDLILEYIALKDMGEFNASLTRAIIDAGTSAPMLARLTGDPVSTIRWRADVAKRG